MPLPNGKKLVLGIEGSANKIGVGIVTEDGDVLSNPRHTYVNNIYSITVRKTSSDINHFLMQAHYTPRRRLSSERNVNPPSSMGDPTNQTIFKRSRCNER